VLERKGPGERATMRRNSIVLSLRGKQGITKEGQCSPGKTEETYNGEILVRLPSEEGGKRGGATKKAQDSGADLTVGLPREPEEKRSGSSI